ncbi:TPA: carbamoyl transferase [Candidatus Micrarchaeota archaeon]|jgi:carbamoyltransferase|nr:carbamoyl transferase [Candidatus Micrarchaeota archaeon]HII09738.1 carbamoyl transferase [Candidatus Micrarchaeota archaeon]
MVRYVLGLNCAYHESSCALIKDGELVTAVEEERFNRIRHAKPANIDNPYVIPVNSVRYCLESENLKPNDIYRIGFSLNPTKRARNRHIKDITIKGGWGTLDGETTYTRLINSVPLVLSALLATDVTKRFVWLPHHICHAASAYFVSGFDDSAVMSVDGIGEIDTTFLSIGRKNKLTQLPGSMQYPNSLGFFWEKFSKYLGFSEYDASKVMGLAAYGDRNVFFKKMLTLIRYRSDGSFKVNNELLRFRVEDYRPLEKLFGPRRLHGEEITDSHKNVAAALQAVTEDILLNMVKHLGEVSNSKNLSIAGGVMLNCVANGLILDSGYFDNYYIQPASNDAGTSVGAAYYIWNHVLGNENRTTMKDAYTGPSYTDSAIIDALKMQNLKYRESKNIEKETARLISEGKVVAWFQGKMEFGPRALGNRSILADPRRKDMRDILNRTIKHREYFRPLGPSILTEDAEEWFEIKKRQSPSDFMLVTYKAKENKKNLIPAVVHEDGTSRIHTVNKSNYKYHKLIVEFKKLTKVPVLLNTSYNDSEPIVCSPKDAIDTFMKSKIDVLVMHDYIVERRGQEYAKKDI